MTRREQLNQILIAHRFLLLQFTWLFVVIACAGIVKMFAEERGVGERFAKLTFVGVFFALILVPVAVLYLYGKKLAKHRRALGLCERCGFEQKGSTERCARCGTKAGQ
jgi:hypothetical protein